MGVNLFDLSTIVESLESILLDVFLLFYYTCPIIFTSLKGEFSKEFLIILCLECFRLPCLNLLYC